MMPEWLVIVLSILIIVCTWGIIVVDHIRDKINTKSQLEMFMNGACENCKNNFAECQKYNRCLNYNKENKNDEN